MLDLVIPDARFFDPKTNMFTLKKGGTIRLEHSLLSVSKWEETTEKPFLKPGYKMTTEETILYVRCMTVSTNVREELYSLLTDENIKQIDEYIGRKMTATTFSDNGRPSREIITNELVYYWMFKLGIPKECEKWHLNKLFTLIKLASIKEAPKKKMSHTEAMRQYDKINEARRKALHSKG